MNTTKHPGGLACAAAAAAVLLLPAAAAAAPPVPAKNISNTGGLVFGRFAAAGGGAVSVGIDGVRSRSGGVVLLSSTAAPASFSVGSSNQGNDNKVYVLTLPSNGSVSLVSGANRMPLNNFVSNVAPGSPLPTGVQTVTVGATLQVSASQAPGNYAGNFNVTLEYQ